MCPGSPDPTPWHSPACRLGVRNHRISPAWKGPQSRGLSGLSPRPPPSVGGSCVREGAPLRARVGLTAGRDVGGRSASGQADAPRGQVTARDGAPAAKVVPSGASPRAGCSTTERPTRWPWTRTRTLYLSEPRARAFPSRSHGPEVRLPADCLDQTLLPRVPTSKQTRGLQPPDPSRLPPAGLGLSAGPISLEPKLPQAENRRERGLSPHSPFSTLRGHPHFSATLTTAKAHCKAGVALFKVAWRKLQRLLPRSPREHAI